MSEDEGTDWRWHYAQELNRASKLEAENDKLRQELEAERLRLAACGTAALMNTERTVTSRVVPGDPHYSSSYGDVCRAVDREMALLQERDALKAEITRLVREDGLLNQARAEQAEAELSAPTARRCAGCVKWDECGDSCDSGQGLCAYFGEHTREDFTCGAWEGREGA